jgi:hypothetical protein
MAAIITANDNTLFSGANSGMQSVFAKLFVLVKP